MKCSICNTEIKWLWFDSSRIFAQCPKNPYHLVFFIEPLLKKPLRKIILDREERLREKFSNTNTSIVFINQKEARTIAALGSRVDSPAVMEIVNATTKKDIEALREKYAPIIEMISEEIEHEPRIFKRRIK
ncbi:MAG: hypothetical protein U9N04_01300 [Patescibacteria group bacterium]|nr:hypothetical protein [Patescibacteria group bacterium]